MKHLMKRLSIRFKITLWFSVALIVVVALTYVVIFAVSKQVIQKTIRDSLIETVTHNIDEIEYYSDIDQIDIYNTVDHFAQYKEGFLEVDDDFLDEVNEVYTALYESDGTFIYGENPIARNTVDLEFADGKVQKTTVDGVLYYVYDSKLIQPGLEDLWLRGVVSEVQGEVQMSDISQMSLVLLPILVLVSIVGGYLIARRMLRPIQKISDSAAQIHQGGDLKKRIELGEGSDELHQLAENFNMMFQRLDSAFQKERQFTSDASHELRTPMSVIMAQCELSLEQQRSPEEYEEALMIIQRQGRKMTKLINDMLDFARLEMKSDKYPLESTDFSQLTDSICSDMALIQENGITLTWDVQPDIIVYGNRDLLSRLLTNLISNAYRYGKQKGHIIVSLTCKNNTVRLDVKDDGVGIAPEEQQKVFSRFYQGDSSRSGVGTGLGLSMVQEIAKFHGGEIQLTSQLGVGSTFSFILLQKN